MLPVVLGFLYVGLYGVTVAYGDQWRIAHLFGKLSTDSLSVAHLWTQLNEHRILVPKVLMLSLGALTNWSNVAEMYATQVLLLLTLLVLFAGFRTSVRSKWTLPLFVPVPFLVFSLRQAENMLMGLLMQFALVLVFAVFAFYFLDDARRRSFGGPALAAALASATLASLSSAHGLLVWPAGLVQILVGSARGRRGWLFAGLWCLVGAAEWAFYFLGWHTPPHDPTRSGTQVGATPLYPVRFFVTAVGAPLSWWQGPALVVGLILLALVAVALVLLWREGKLGECSFWVALLSFSFLVLIALTVGRAAWGIEQALISRYTTYSLLGLVGLYGVLAKLLVERGSRLTAGLFGALVVLVLLSVPISYAGGVKVGMTTEATRRQAALVLATYESRSDAELSALYPNPRVVRSRAPILERLGYNVFDEPAAEPSRPARAKQP